VLLNAEAQTIGGDAILADPLLHGAIERKMQPPAMNADLRILIARALAARLLVNELAEAVEEAALGVLDAGAQQLVAQAKRRQLTHRVREQRDADAELPHLRRGFVNAARDLACMQIQRKR